MIEWAGTVGKEGLHGEGGSKIGLDWYKLGKGRQRRGNDQQAHGYMERY